MLLVQKEIMRLLGDIWSTMPEIRFNQMLHNLSTEFNEQHDGKYKTEAYVKEENNGVIAFRNEGGYVDMFNVGDHTFVQFLQKKAQKVRGVQLPADAKMVRDLSLTTGSGFTTKFEKNSIVRVIAKIESDNFGSGIGYVILHKGKDSSLTVDSANINFDF